MRDRLRSGIIYGFTKSSQPCLLLASVLLSMLYYVVKFIDGDSETRIIDEPVAILFDIFRRLLVVYALLVAVATAVNYSEARSLLRLFIWKLL